MLKTCIFLIRALLAQEAEEERTDSIKECKYEYKINKNISISVLKDEIVEVLINPKRDLKKFCEKTKNLMKKSTIPIRPGRKFQRIRKSRRKYPMNARRAL